MKTKHRRSVLIACCLLHTLVLHHPTLHAQCRHLVWADEFDGPLLDRAKWDTRIGNDWDLLHYNTDRINNIRVSNGMLQIIAREEDHMGFAYTSALLHTEDIAAWRYGRIEARMKLPGTRGFVPAFWLLPAHNRYGWWPRSGEIDIMEHPTHQPHTVYGTVHTEAYNLLGGVQGPQGGTLNLSDLETAFHLYAVEWNEERIDFYVDDIKYFTFTHQDTDYTTWPFDQPFFIRLGLGVGGGWVGPPNAATVFPAVMEIDYVRVYQDLQDVAITGMTHVLPNERNVLYTIPEISGAAYTWNVTGSARIVSGQATSRIAIDWQHIGGIVSVEVVTDCGSHTVVCPVEVTNNLLGNPDFEQGVKYWSAISGYPAAADIALTADDVHNGRQSLRLEVKSLGPNAWDVQVSQADLYLESAQRYRVGFWGKTEVGNRRINTAIINPNDYTFYGGESFVLTDTWTPYTFDFSVPVNVSASLNLDAGVQTGTYYLDSFSLKRTDATDPQHLSNGDFSGGVSDWHLTALWPAQASADVQNGEYRVTIDRAGSFIWDVSLMQQRLRIENGKTYHVLFDAYSSQPLLISALVGKDSAPWTVYSGSHEFALSTSKQTYAYTFTMKQATDANARLGFDLGSSTGQVSFDNIVLTEETRSR